ncbi:MAG TPA: 16S rRNA (adenine(1518)-N(6)/adenine(1519)-N(6))-dimethyltransferase RsmA, partial [Bacteroidota bacterium]|nr:16S rRNA (adenine(1518)-N(6)/adenine(1519)-N(6))-dimethyltransferase RsmA [Bacteroidota bacterium]
MIAPKKSLGQHFLKDENIVRKIIQSLQLKNTDVIVEIGPGRGALTKYLVEQNDHVIGIEVDSGAAGLLRENFGGKLKIIIGDVLKVDLTEFFREQSRKLRVVGNIPYYITSEILFWLFDQKDKLADATLMMQQEVARRLTAKPGSKDYGILSIFTQLYTRADVLFKVSRNSFYPKPNVDSAVVRLDFSSAFPTCNVTLLKNIVRVTFGKRRKTLRNGLRDLGFSDQQLDSIQFDLKKRPEELTLSDFLELTGKLEPYRGSATMKF